MNEITETILSIIGLGSVRIWEGLTPIKRETCV